MAIGERIQAYRIKSGLSQKELAQKLSISTGLLAEIEANDISLSIELLQPLCAALGVSAEELLSSETPSVMEDESKSESPGGQLTNIQNIQEKPQKANKPEVKEPQKKKGKKVLIMTVTIAGLAIALLIVALFLFVKKPFSNDPKAIEQAATSVVKVYCYDYKDELVATGSGFVAFDDQTIITNYHVAGQGLSFKISTDQDVTYSINHILEWSEDYDIAIFQVEKPTGLTPLTIGDADSLQKGDTVTAIGSPLGLKNSVTMGVLSGRVVTQKEF